jgi:hypothetical protein
MIRTVVAKVMLGALLKEIGNLEMTMRITACLLSLPPSPSKAKDKISMAFLQDSHNRYQ